VVSLLALLGCLALVYAMILQFSKRASTHSQKLEKQKQFITDASHELKTPLTVIITSLRVLEMETGRQKWIDKAQAQANNMTELINQLVTLSRLDEERPGLNIAEFCVSDAARETVDSFSDVAAAKGRTLTCDIEPDVMLRGDQLAVRQLVSVLADNAVKYTPEGGEIRFALRRSAKGVTITSRNTCEGMTGQS
jgi:signal transduction histidine kinase